MSGRRAAAARLPAARPPSHPPVSNSSSSSNSDEDAARPAAARQLSLAEAAAAQAARSQAVDAASSAAAGAGAAAQAAAAGAGGPNPATLYDKIKNDFSWLCSRAGIATTTFISWVTKKKGPRSIQELITEYNASKPKHNSTSLMFKNILPSAAANIQLSKMKSQRFHLLLVKLLYYQKNQDNEKFLISFLDELLNILNIMKGQADAKVGVGMTLAIRGQAPLERSTSGLITPAGEIISWNDILNNPELASVIWAVLHTNEEKLGIEAGKYPITQGGSHSFPTLMEGTTPEHIKSMLDAAHERELTYLVTEEDISYERLCAMPASDRKALFTEINSADLRKAEAQIAREAALNEEAAARAAAAAANRSSASAAAAAAVKPALLYGNLHPSAVKRSNPFLNNSINSNSEASNSNSEASNSEAPVIKPPAKRKRLIGPNYEADNEGGENMGGGYRKSHRKLTRKSNRKSHRKLTRKTHRKTHRKAHRKVHRKVHHKNNRTTRRH